MLNSTDRYNSSELINISVTKSTLNQYSISLTEFFIIDQIYKLDKLNKKISTISFLTDNFPTEFPSRRKARYALNILVGYDYLEKVDTKVDTKVVAVYHVSALGRELCTTASYVLDYTKEDYFKALQVIDAWNSIAEVSKHNIKPYGHGQTKTVHSIIHYVKDVSEGAVEWYTANPTPQLTLDQILRVVDKFSLKFTEGYLPIQEEKKFLPKSLSTFFLHYSKHSSEFFNIVNHGVKEIVRTIDELKDTGISKPILLKAYSVLSESGKATEVEKLDIQKNLIRTHKRWVKWREEMDMLYSWKKQYREHVMSFNTFMADMLSYVGNTCGKGRAKPGFISFRQGNKLMEGFSKEFADKYNIFLWPTARQKENIVNMQK